MTDASAEKIEKKEVDAAMQLYKIAGIVIGTLILIGIVIAIFNSLPERKTVEETLIVENKTSEPLPILNETILLPLQNETNSTHTATLANITTNAPLNTTTANVSNISQQTTPLLNVTNTANISSGVFNYNWSAIKMAYPSESKRLSAGKREYVYINITEIDNTPITNGEQFDLTFYTTDVFGKASQIIPSFENNQWLISPLISNKGNYQLRITITCAEKKGHCLRFYGEGSANATFDFEVV